MYRHFLLLLLQLQLLLFSSLVVVTWGQSRIQSSYRVVPKEFSVHSETVKDEKRVLGPRQRYCRLSFSFVYMSPMLTCQPISSQFWLAS